MKDPQWEANFYKEIYGENSLNISKNQFSNKSVIFVESSNYGANLSLFISSYNLVSCLIDLFLAL